MNLWLMRGGENGCFENDALKFGLAIANWSKLGDLSLLNDKESVRNALQKNYENIATSRINRWIPQIWYFRSRISVGDLLAMPIKRKRFFFIGEVVGNYEFLGEGDQPYKHVRKVNWFDTEVQRADLDNDLRHSLGCLMAICKIKRDNAVERIREML
jgi:restriction system protein